MTNAWPKRSSSNRLLCYAGTNIRSAVTKNQPSCPGSGLYTNCDATIDLTTHSCLDGFACPIGMQRCGNSVNNYACYNPTYQSCKNHKLKNQVNKDDGTQVTACEREQPPTFPSLLRP